MPDLTQGEKEAIVRRMEEIGDRVYNLLALRAGMSAAGCATLAAQLVYEWLDCYRELTSAD
jgi:hypothetical protein